MRATCQNVLYTFTHILLFSTRPEILVATLEYCSCALWVSWLASDIVAVLVLAGTELECLHECVRDVHLVMARTLQETLVEMTCTLALAFPGLKVNVRLPHNFRHVEILLYGKLKDGAYSLKVFHGTFDLGPLDPRGGE